MHRIDISSKFDIIGFVAEEDSEQLRISHCELTRAVSKI